MEKNNIVINETLVKEMLNEGKKVTDDLGYVYDISKSDDGYWGLGRYMPDKGGNWAPFGKRVTDKVINRIVAYMEKVWNLECKI